MPTNIYLLEHNSSRLLFYSSSTDVELKIEDTTSSQYCTEMDGYIYPNNWLLGKLSDHIYYIEDVGIYDSNHEHTAKVYYNDPVTNEETIVWSVTRLMEYGEECDRMYCEHSGGFKVIFIDSPIEDLYANFYIKYERNLPGIFEQIGTLTNKTTGEKHYNCVVFYKYNPDNPDNIMMAEILQLDFNLTVVNDDNTLMDGINYCTITPKQANIDFSRLSVKYSLSENNSNDIKLGMIGASPFNENELDFRHSKFLPDRYYTGNGNFIDPMYFIVQVPKNRSWICYRCCYDSASPGPFYNDRTIDGNICGYIRAKGAGLNGYYGVLNGDKYVYEINIDRSKMPFIFMLPKMFWDYSSIKYYDSNNNVIRVFDGTTIDVYNELDGMSYRIIVFPPASYTAKIILEYTVE